MTDLSALFSPDLVEALERLVDERVAAALAQRTPNAASPWLSIPEAAEYLGTSRRTVERLLASGRLRSAERIGRRRLVLRADLDAAATGEDVAPTTPPRHRGA